MRRVRRDRLRDGVSRTGPPRRPRRRRGPRPSPPRHRPRCRRPPPTRSSIPCSRRSSVVPAALAALAAP
ncbi:hypothetical protein DK419_08770 [Methylobacterium terrae]|uniref:Uncharacterized protein n=1 Tax=Methylobacterium terrae TaxID=2202827 RepID=A0A2U8WUF0_9HYPH|nr:hypothetical protein DK419_08770 [Methylobacterium terrae]